MQLYKEYIDTGNEREQPQPKPYDYQRALGELHHYYKDPKSALGVPENAGFIATQEAPARTPFAFYFWKAD